MLILAIDPGNDTGWAIDQDGRLIGCGVSSKGSFWAPRKVDHMVIERPEVYQARFMKGNPNDIITLAITVGELCERVRPYCTFQTLVLPKQWKGSIDKDVHHGRIQDALSPEDLAFVAEKGKRYPKSKTHNMWDAIGLVKWFRGTLLRK